MLIELATFPPAVQQQLRHIPASESIDIVDNGKPFAKVLLKQNPLAHDDVLDDEVFGILSGIDGVEYQNQIRQEWDDYVAH